MTKPSSYDLAIRVIPRSPRNIVDGERAGRLLVRVTAAPVDGRANEVLRRVLADHLGVAERAIEVVAGHRSRDKVVRVACGGSA